jgi:hypothetical protein
VAFDKDTRILLAKTVAACRGRLTEDVTDQLRGVFGLHPDGTMLAMKEMTHLSPDPPRRRYSGRADLSLSTGVQNSGLATHKLGTQNRSSACVCGKNEDLPR